MRFWALCVIGLIWASAAGAQNPEEVQGRWVRLVGANPKDSLVATFHADGRYENQKVFVASGLKGLYVSARWILRGTWLVRAPVEGERGRGIVPSKDMVICTVIKSADMLGRVTYPNRVSCKPYVIEETPDRLKLFWGWDYYERLKT